MNGKRKILTSATIGIIIAIAIISAIMLLPTQFSASSDQQAQTTTPREINTARDSSVEGPLIVQPSEPPPEQGAAPSAPITEPPSDLPGAPPTTPETTSEMGRLVLLVKDAPKNETGKKVLDTLEIRIQGVILHRSSENVSRVNFPVTNSSTWFDLTALTGGLTDVVGNVSVPTGKYTMVVFNITDARAKFKDSESGIVDANYTTLKIVGNGKLKSPLQFNIESGLTTEVTLDFQLDQMKVNPQGILRPVIKATTKDPT